MEARKPVGQCSCGGVVLLTDTQARAARRFGVGVAPDGSPAWDAACDACQAAKGAIYARERAEDERRHLVATVRSRMTESRMPEALLTHKVPGSEPTDPECEREARLLARTWAASVDAPPMLLLWGDKGRGKTVLAASAFAWALRRRPGYWAPGVRLLRDIYGEYESAERARAERVAQGRTMVVLDDVDKIMGERSGEQLFGVIDALYSFGTPCIITMNGTPDAAAKRWGTCGPMIADRLAAATRAQFSGPSWRRVGMAA